MGTAAKKKKIFDGRYEVLSIVGRGSASVVYHARHATASHQEVALKVLVNQKGHEPSSERLRKEALAMVSSRHKYVIRLDDFHAVNDLCYLSMEFAPEGDLRKYTEKLGGKLSHAQAELFLTQCAEALDFVHKVGITHRDIKPDNILVVNDKEIRLADFGVAVLPGEKTSLADLRAGVGTMNYMAPEVLEGTGYDKRADIYALGAAFYELISGVHPFENVPLIKQLEVRQDDKIPHLSSRVPNLPRHLANVIMQAMSYDLNKRFPTARDLIQTLLVNKTQAKSSVVPERQAPAATQDSSLTRPDPKQANKSGTERKPVRPMGAPEKRAVDTTTPSNLQQAKKPVPLTQAPRDTMALGSEAVNAITGKEQQIVPGGASNLAETMAISAEEMARSIESRGRNAASEERAEPSRRQEPPPSSHVRKERPKREPPHQHSRPSPSSRSRIAPFFFLVLLAVGVAYAARGHLGGLFSRGGNGEGDPGQGISTGASSSPSTSPIPAYKGEPLDFPRLPAGVYSGSIEGILPGTPLTLTFISFADQGRLAVIVGLEGWSPRVIPMEQPTQTSPDQPAKPLRVASNGIVLDISGQVFDGQEISGYFKNVLTGEQGTWHVRPQS